METIISDNDFDVDFFRELIDAQEPTPPGYLPTPVLDSLTPVIPSMYLTPSLPVQTFSNEEIKQLITVEVNKQIRSLCEKQHQTQKQRLENNEIIKLKTVIEEQKTIIDNLTKELTSKERDNKKEEEVILKVDLKTDVLLDDANITFRNKNNKQDMLQKQLIEVRQNLQEKYRANLLVAKENEKNLVTNGSENEQKPDAYENIQEQRIEEEKQPLQQSTDQEKIQQENKSQKRIEIVGDSMLNAIEERGLGKHNQIKLNKHPGASSLDMIDHIKPVLRRNPDHIILHVGTNDITKNINLLYHAKEIYKLVKERCPSTKLTFSSIIRRYDIKDGAGKVNELNGRLKDFCNQNAINYLDNSNIEERSLGMKKLHLNRNGNRHFAKNLINHIC